MKIGDRVRVVRCEDEPRLLGAEGTLSRQEGSMWILEMDERREGFRSKEALVYENEVEAL